MPHAVRMMPEALCFRAVRTCGHPWWSPDHVPQVC